MQRRIALLGVLTLLVSLFSTAVASAEDFEVAVLDFEFAPQTQYIHEGDTVNWVWDGAAPHNVTPDEEGLFEPSPTQTEGEYPLPFEEPGTIGYHCTLHGGPGAGMAGTIEVLPEGEPFPEPVPEPVLEPGPVGDVPDNIGAALAWSAFYPDGSTPDVVLGRSDLFADSLSSGSAQGLLGAPLLLTAQDSLDPRVEAELARLGAERVIIMGGSAAIDDTVEARLMELGYTVERLEGATRTETALDTAGTLFESATVGLLVRSTAAGADPTQEFADSLGGGAWAAIAGWPIFFTQTSVLTGTTRDYLQGSAIERIFAIGGTAAIADSVLDEVRAINDIEVERVSGPTRFDTAGQVAIMAASSGPPDFGIFVEGQSEDAWAAGFSAASLRRPVLLTNGDLLPEASTFFAFNVGAAGGGIICGPDVTDVACDLAEAAATGTNFPDPEQTLFAVLSGENEVAGDGGQQATGDSIVSRTDDPGTVCYEAFLNDVDTPILAAHIHVGGPTENGPPVVTFATGFQPFGYISNCTFGLDPAVVEDIFTNPGNYYVNLHTEAHPDGAVRGQLDGIAPPFFLTEALGEPTEEGFQGAFAFGFGRAGDPSAICYYYGYEFASPLTDVTLHMVGETDTVLVDLELPLADDDNQTTQCTTGVPADLMTDLAENPSDYFLLFSTEAEPDGAAAGVLVNPLAGPPEKRAATAAAWRTRA